MPVFESSDHCDSSLSVPPGGIGPRVHPSSSAPSFESMSIQPLGSLSSALGWSLADCPAQNGTTPRTNRTDSPRRNRLAFMVDSWWETWALPAGRRARHGVHEPDSKRSPATLTTVRQGTLALGTARPPTGSPEPRHPTIDGPSDPPGHLPHHAGLASFQAAKTALNPS